MRFNSSCLFDIGQPLLVDFNLCTPTRLVFFTLVSHCWWTLTCALPLVLSFLYWSVTVVGLWLACALLLIPIVLSFSLWAVTVGGLWLVRSHSSCVFDIGQSLLVDFDLRVSTRLVCLTLVNHCWWTLTFALPLVLSFSHWSVTIGGLWLVRSHSSCLFDIGQSLLVDFNFCRANNYVMVGLCKQHCFDAIHLGLYNRQQVGVTPFSVPPSPLSSPPQKVGVL